MPATEGDEEEVKEEKEIKSLIPKKLSTRLPILLTRIKVRSNSYKIKNEMRQILYLLYQHNRSLKKFATI